MNMYNKTPKKQYLIKFPLKQSSKNKNARS